MDQNTKSYTRTEHHLSCALKEEGDCRKKYAQTLMDTCFSRKTILEEMNSDKTRRCSKTLCKNVLSTYKMEIMVLFLASEVLGELLVKSAARLNELFFSQEL